jgi:hypothetical protein
MVLHEMPPLMLLIHFHVWQGDPHKNKQTYQEKKKKKKKL